MVSRIFANSPGWIEKPATRIQMRAPLTSLKRAGSTAGRIKQEEADQRQRVGVARERAVVARSAGSR